MMVSDPIADMLTKIRNAGRAKHASCKVKGSKIKKAILDIMKDEGFITDVQEVKERSFTDYEVFLKYDDSKKSVIREIAKVSKPGRRVYIQSSEVKPFKSNLGVTILSTSKGVMTNKKASKLNIGGEVICSIS
ncbi:MAG: 30S ribosomal protein S8 [Leptospiraceae bacterium]|nr:30S ribosomal protein S8 [Leptospiraceae bacterium]